MPLLHRVRSKIGVSQPFQHFLSELLLLLLIVPGRATFRNLSRYSAYSLPNSYPYMRMNQISIFLSNSHRGILKIFDLIEESHHESEVDV